MRTKSPAEILEPFSSFLCHCCFSFSRCVKEEYLATSILTHSIYLHYTIQPYHWSACQNDGKSSVSWSFPPAIAPLRLVPLPPPHSEALRVLSCAINPRHESFSPKGAMLMANWLTLAHVLPASMSADQRGSIPVVTLVSSVWPLWART